MGAGMDHEGVGFSAAFEDAGFKAVGAVANRVGGDRSEQAGAPFFDGDRRVKDRQQLMERLQSSLSRVPCRQQTQRWPVPGESGCKR